MLLGLLQAAEDAVIIIIVMLVSRYIAYKFESLTTRALDEQSDITTTNLLVSENVNFLMLLFYFICDVTLKISLNTFQLRLITFEYKIFH